MALLNRKEVQILIGITSGNLSNYIKRGKLILSGDFIDDSISPNKEFLDAQILIKAKKDAESEEPSIETFNIPPNPNVTSPLQVVKDAHPTIKNTSTKEDLKAIINLDRKKKEVDIRKTEEDTVYRQLQIEKMQGDNIPTVLVREVFRRHSKNITAAMKAGIENLIIEFEKYAGLSREDVAKLRGRTIQVINDSVNDAVALSKKEINNIVSEVSVKRVPGQK